VTNTTCTRAAASGKGILRRAPGAAASSPALSG
jgi:hypothetical protein